MHETLLLLFLFCGLITSVKIIDNGIAPPEIVVSPISNKPRCVFNAPPLDLIFLLDSSGSLRDKFQDEVDIIRRIVKHVAIEDTATRVMLIQFSGTAHLEWGLGQISSREGILAALEVLRFVSGITRIGGAFEFARNILTQPNSGLRGGSIPKILYILSDGRTHDYPMDWQMADTLRRDIPGIDIWAYGTGEYVAWPALLNYTKRTDKIVTNANLDELEKQFEAFRGTEVCEKVPSCVKGTDHPVDLVLVVDASESVAELFREQTKFAVERVVNHINVHPDAVRVALISYSGTPFVHFTLGQRWSNQAVVSQLLGLRSIKGVTSTDAALLKADEILYSPKFGAREGVAKLVLVISDGRSQKNPAAEAKKIRDKGGVILAVSVSSTTHPKELASMTGDPARVFIAHKNIHDFETEFTKHVGFGCPGLDVAKEAKPFVRGATDISCAEGQLKLTVRTKYPMKGKMYAQHFHTDPSCTLESNGEDREISLTLREGTCGLRKTPVGLDVGCFEARPLTEFDVLRSEAKRVTDTQCSYTIHKYDASQCVALDAKVGETLHHKWSCDAPPNYHFLVHDCYAKSETKSVPIIDSDGCAIDEHFLETPNYSRFLKIRDDSYVYQEMSVFKFPGDDHVTFECKISLCDREDPAAACNSLIPPRCDNRKPREAVAENINTQAHIRLRRQLLSPKNGFEMTVPVQASVTDLPDLTFIVLPKKDLTTSLPSNHSEITQRFAKREYSTEGTSQVL